MAKKITIVRSPGEAGQVKVENIRMQPVERKRKIRIVPNVYPNKIPTRR